MGGDSRPGFRAPTSSAQSLSVCTVTLLCVACAGAAPDARGGPAEKIAFDLSMLDAVGLYGPPDGLRSLSYEFCVPAGQRFTEQVRSIDPTAQVYARARGRIGCRADQQLVIGHTHQSGYRKVLQALAGLPYVERIEQAFFE